MYLFKIGYIHLWVPDFCLKIDTSHIHFQLIEILNQNVIYIVTNTHKNSVGLYFKVCYS